MNIVIVCIFYWEGFVKKNIIFVKFVNSILRKDSFFIGLYDFNLIYNIIVMFEYNELIVVKWEWLNN